VEDRGIRFVVLAHMEQLLSGPENLVSVTYAYTSLGPNFSDRLRIIKVNVTLIDLSINRKSTNGAVLSIAIQPTSSRTLKELSKQRRRSSTKSTKNTKWGYLDHPVSPSTPPASQSKSPGIELGTSEPAKKQYPLV
jgi:hypothetical protein